MSVPTTGWTVRRESEPVVAADDDAAAPTDVSVLAEEMEMNDVLRCQVDILTALLSAEQRAEYERICRKRRIGPAPPMPRVLS